MQVINKRRLAVAMTAASVAVAAYSAPAQATLRAPGFSQPFAGNPKYQRYAPRQATSAAQINRPLGAKAANRLALNLGLDPEKVFTAKQYALFISGKGVGGDPASAKLVDASVKILTNTIGNPLYSSVNGTLTPSVLGSYGVFVNPSGLLESPANLDAATRQVNAVIEPGGYLPTWCRHNGANATMRMLYRSAYTSEAVYGNKAQQQSGAAQLVTNTKAGETTIVGMSMVPPLWIVNFALIYALNPKLAAKMPAYWTPIPPNVASAIAASTTGQVPYSEYAASFPS